MKLNAATIFICVICIFVPSRAQAQGDGVRRGPETFEPYSKKEIATRKREVRDWSKGVMRISSMKGTVAEVVEYFSKEFGSNLPLSANVDQKRRVNFRGGKRTLHRCLANIGLRAEGAKVIEIREETFIGRASMAQFYALPKAWRGDKPGTVYELKTTFSQVWATKYFQAAHWRVVGFKGKKPVVFESCKFHSPDKSMVRNGQEPVTSIQVEGEFWWTYKLSVLMKDFRNGDVIRIGKYDITLDWPNIVTTLPENVPSSISTRMLSFDAVMKKESPEDDAGGIGWGGGAGGSFGRPRNKDWCGCIGSAKAGVSPGLVMHKVGQKVYAVNSKVTKNSTLKDVEKLIIGIRLPVKEKFKVTLKVAKPKR